MSPPTRTWRQHTTRRGGLREDVIDSATPPPTSSRRRCDAGRAAEGHCGLHYAAANELEEQAAADEKMEEAHDEAGAWRDYVSFLYPLHLDMLIFLMPRAHILQFQFREKLIGGLHYKVA
jgi:hypothetical protein